MLAEAFLGLHLVGLVVLEDILDFRIHLLVLHRTALEVVRVVNVPECEIGVVGNAETERVVDVLDRFQIVSLHSLEAVGVVVHHTLDDVLGRGIRIALERVVVKDCGTEGTVPFLAVHIPDAGIGERPRNGIVEINRGDLFLSLLFVGLKTLFVQSVQSGLERLGALSEVVEGGRDCDFLEDGFVRVLDTVLCDRDG